MLLEKTHEFQVVPDKQKIRRFSSFQTSKMFWLVTPIFWRPALRLNCLEMPHLLYSLIYTPHIYYRWGAAGMCNIYLLGSTEIDKFLKTSSFSKDAKTLPNFISKRWCFFSLAMADFWVKKSMSYLQREQSINYGYIDLTLPMCSSSALFRVNKFKSRYATQPSWRY